jgi:tetratricopeptide (TPR) repeat protein
MSRPLLLFSVLTACLLPGALHAAAPASQEAFCLREAELCAVVGALGSPELDTDTAQRIRYLAASYLSCLTWNGTDPGSFPKTKPWDSISAESATQMLLYETLASSLKNDLPAALLACNQVRRPIFSDKFCRSLFGAYRSYYTPVCRDAAADYPDRDPVELEHICRSNIYPDKKTCSLLKDASRKEHCLDLLNTTLASGQRDAPACLDSTACRAFYRRAPGECDRIRGRVLSLYIPPRVKGETGNRAASRELSDSAAGKIRDGELVPARRLLLKSLELDPVNPEALIDLCVVNDREGRKTEALNACLAAAEAASKQAAPAWKVLSSEARFLGAQLLYELGRSTESVKLLGECIEQAPPGWERLEEAKNTLRKGAAQ